MGQVDFGMRGSWGARLKLPIDRLRRLVYTECGAGGLIVCLIAHLVDRDQAPHIYDDDDDGMMR